MPWMRSLRTLFVEGLVAVNVPLEHHPDLFDELEPILGLRLLAVHSTSSTTSTGESHAATVSNRVQILRSARY